MRRSKTVPEGLGTVLFLSRKAVEDLRAIHAEDSTGDASVFGRVGANRYTAGFGRP